MPRGPFRLPPGEMPLNMERGGAVCDASGTGRTAHMLMGSGSPGACMPTLGADTRSRWRAAEGPGSIHSGSQLVSKRASRHSLEYEKGARGAAGRAHRARTGE